MSLSPFRAEFAATIFVRECLRQWMKLHPGASLDDAPMKALCDYPQRERQAIIKAVEKAVEASTGMEDLYKLFLQDKLASGQSKAS
jgi:hypothetical protein